MANSKELKTGEVLSENQFYKVVGIGHDVVELENVDGFSIKVSKEYVDKHLNSAHQYAKGEKVSQTRLIELLLKNERIAMTVNFNKKLKVADQKKKIYDLYPNKGGKIQSEAAFKKAVNEAIDMKGEERAMVGYHYGDQYDTGRLKFIDMEETAERKGAHDPKIKQVNPQTLNWIIVKGVKYIKK